jgi:hypothetical protein
MPPRMMKKHMNTLRVSTNLADYSAFLIVPSPYLLDREFPMPFLMGLGNNQTASYVHECYSIDLAHTDLD